MTLKVGATQACAACKYQRRKCTPDCPLAPYFPPHNQKVFHNVHRLFGVSKVLKLLKHLDNSKRADAMRSIISEADIRDRFPIHGCLAVISQLNYQIYWATQELHSVQAQLEFFRRHHHQQSQLDSGKPGPSRQSPLPPYQ